MMTVALDEPITFDPVYQQRVWGGRRLESRLGRSLPDAQTPFGESWELSDREEAMSVVNDGPFAGKTLRNLWCNHREEIFGQAGVAAGGDRFPLLIKILDCCEDLSVQVHPPEAYAAEHGGEPKTEMWYVASAEPGAKLYVGLKGGVTPEQFERAIHDGSVADLIGVVEPKAGDFVHIPSGRIHAIGGGLLIFEIQQNSDTTYRVFDWNRKGLNGKPRDLHIDAALGCINFNDVPPSLGQADGEVLVSCEYFKVEAWNLKAKSSRCSAPQGECAVVSIVRGNLTCGGRDFSAGDFFLVSASAEEASRQLDVGAEGAEILVMTLPL